MQRRKFLQSSAILPAAAITCGTAVGDDRATERSRIEPKRKVILEPTRELPITHEADVLVVGGTEGGLGGCFAAIAAGRAGAKTIFVEQSGHIDLHVPLGLGPVLGVPKWRPTIQEGIFRDLAEYVVKVGQHANQPTTFDALLERGEIITRYHDVVTTAILQMMQDAGVRMLFHTKFVDAVSEGNSLRAVVVESPQGRHALTAKVFIDSTGLGEVAAAAGAPMLREEPYMGLQAYFAGVDEQKFKAWTQANNQPLDDSYRGWLETIVGPFAKLENPWNQWWPELLGNRYAPAYVRQAKAAHANGDLAILHRYKETGIMAIPEGIKMDVGIARPRTYVTGTDPLNVDDVSWAEVTSRLMLAQYQRFLKKYLPGFDHCVIERVADSIGLRGGRYLNVPTLPQASFKQEGKRPDAIFVMKKSKGEIDIPYGVLLPERVEGLLVVGKASAGGRTLGTAHVALFQGQAAGIAAAIAVKEGTTPRQINLKQLQRRLKETGVDVTAAET